MTKTRADSGLSLESEKEIGESQLCSYTAKMKAPNGNMFRRSMSSL